MDRKRSFEKIVISVMVGKNVQKFLTFVEDEPDFQGGPIPSKVSYSQENQLDGLHVVSSAYF
ncbi:AMP_1a_G0052850.mRNA.1.CDS.1 [Saccharomyces cerevisiae]|nr:AMP_1a_G0052850.mRNA.1.CDS.1 [Saccharomyces cerevisiae]CAI6897639.1 AMP_1a_G0052850.mRNA.1.CDS.1 [Saccharomyces cerevisiae]